MSILPQGQLCGRSGLSKIVRHRRLKCIPLAGAGMFETKFPCVQHLAFVPIGLFRAVDFIADYRMANVMQVDPYLMRPAAMQTALDQAHFIGRFYNPVIGLRHPAAAWIYRHFLSVNRMASDFFIDRSSGFAEFSPNERQINLVDGARSKLIR